MNFHAAAALLGVGADDPFKTVRARYLELVREAHPDKGGSNARFAAVNEAYKTLADRAGRPPPAPVSTAPPRPRPSRSPRAQFGHPGFWRMPAFAVRRAPTYQPTWMPTWTPAGARPPQRGVT